MNLLWTQAVRHEAMPWHHDLDKDPARTKDQEEARGDETWIDPEHWDEDDHEFYGSAHR